MDALDSSRHMLLEHERYSGLGMDALVTVCSWTQTLLGFGHGCFSHRMLLEHELYFGLGMDALVTVYALGTRSDLWFGLGCSGHRMLVENKRNCGLGMHAIVTVFSWIANGTMVWAWML